MIFLRPEKFGGIVFNPENAHQLWLDQELFNSLKNRETNSDVRTVCRELEINRPEFKLISAAQSPENFPFTVLSAPVLADIHITTRCNLRCPHCYANSGGNGIDMALADFCLAVDECKKAGVFQIALGGGEPTLHPLFTNFLKEIRQRGIVPNVTTNGKNLSWKTIYHLAKYAGATALSAEEIGKEFEERRNFPFTDFIKTVKKLKAAGIKLVFQITVSKGNLARIKKTVNFLVKYKPYGILFLAYKPQGRGKNYDLPLAMADQAEVKKNFREIFNDLKGKTKIGCDCCLTPALMHFENNLNFQGCSASRESVAITSDLKVVPCSFLNNLNGWDGLKEKSLLGIWQGEKFNDFRERIAQIMTKKKCVNCTSLKTCLGGCPEFEIVKCIK